MEQQNPICVYIGTDYHEGPEGKFFSFVLNLLQPKLIPYGIKPLTTPLDNHAKGVLSFLQVAKVLIDVTDQSGSIGKSKWLNNNPEIPQMRVIVDFQSEPSNLALATTIIAQEIRAFVGQLPKPQQ